MKRWNGFFRTKSSDRFRYSLYTLNALFIEAEMPAMIDCFGFAL